MHGVEFTLGTYDLYVVIIHRWADASVLDRRAKRTKHRECIFERRLGEGWGLDVRLIQMAQHTDAQTLHAAAQCRAIVGNVVVSTRGVFRVVAGDEAQKDRAVL